jgi:hypothetical protein
MRRISRRLYSLRTNCKHKFLPETNFPYRAAAVLQNGFEVPTGSIAFAAKKDQSSIRSVRAIGSLRNDAFLDAITAKYEKTAT